MYGGTHRFDNCPIYYLPQQYQYTPEEFREVTEIMVPDVMDYYMISNYGRLFHKYQNRYLNGNVDSKGYLYKPLATKSGKPKNCRIHRLVMLAFRYFPGCESYDINHIDGNKLNPFIENLEWCTMSENIQHAYDTGLRSHGHIPEETIRKICKMLEDPNNSLKYVSEVTGVNYGTICAIQRGSVHRNISKGYNLTLKKVKSNFSIETIEKLCKYYQDNKRPKEVMLNDYIKSALSYAGGEINDTTIKGAKRIYWKNTHKRITKNYNF